MAVVVPALLALLFFAGCGASEDGDASSASLPSPFDVTDWTFVAPDGSHAPVKLPAHFDDRLPAAPVTYLLRAHIEIPKSMRRGDFVLGFPGLRANAKLVAGPRASIEGVRLDQSPLDGYHPVHELRFRIPNEALDDDGILRVELRVDHRWMYSAWVEQVPRIGPAKGRFGGLPSVVALDVVNHTFAIAAFAAGLFVALLYGYLGFAMRGSVEGRAFALFAVGTAANLFYPATLIGLTQPLLGTYECAVIGAALALGAVCAMAFSKAYFHLEPVSPWWWAWVALSGIAAAVARDPFHSVRILGVFVVVTTMANVIVQLLLFVRLRKMASPRNNVRLLALAWPVTAVLAAPDFLGWIGWGRWFGGVLTACAGITVIAMLQAAALLRDHLRSLKLSDALNKELASRISLLEKKQSEIELLNDELRHQIAARSRQLVDTLVKTEPPASLVPRRVLSEGEIVEGRYRVVRLIGEGGMGAVHEVQRLADGGHFAMKVLSGVSDPVQRARFAREAQIAAGVKHPNVVGLVDFDVTHEGFLYLVMELVSSETLRKVRKRATDVPWSCFVLAQVAEGLDAIHAQGIVHRDLKPANVLLSRGSDGRRPLVKITDFGVSSMIAEELRASQRKLQAATPTPATPPPPPGRARPGSNAETSKEGVGVDSLPSIEFVPIESPTITDDEDDAPTREDSGRRRSGVAPPPRELTGSVTRPEPLRQPVPGAQPPPPPAVIAAAPVAPAGAVPTPPTATVSATPYTDDPALTRPGIVFGTPHYMAVELIEGKATRAADIYSFGIIAWELIAHRRPFDECALRSALKGRLYEAAPIASVVPGLHPELASLIDRCVSHDPMRRPTAREVATVFHRHAEAPTVRGGRVAGGT